MDNENCFCKNMYSDLDKQGKINYLKSVEIKQCVTLVGIKDVNDMNPKMQAYVGPEGDKTYLPCYSDDTRTAIENANVWLEKLEANNG